MILNNYILKGFKVSLCNEIKENLITLYEDYFFTKAISHFNPHFVKPLSLDYVVDCTSHKSMSIYIEILSEYESGNKITPDTGILEI